MKQLLRFFFLLAAAHTAQAQTPNHYVFSQTTGTYTELTDDTAVTPAIFGSGNLYWLQSLTGDSFPLFNQTIIMDTMYRYIAFSTDGYVVITTDTDRMMICDGLFRSLDSIDNNSGLSYRVEGSGSNKVVKVQWKNLKIRSGQPGNFVNFQIWVYQATGAIEYHYGPSSASNASGYTVSSGPGIGISYNDIAFTQVFEKIWLSNLPSSLTIDTGKTLAYPNIRGVPQEGSVYRFLPRSIAVSVLPAVDTPPVSSLHPNPAADRLMLAFSAPLQADLEVRVYDMQGRVALTGIARKGRQQEVLDISRLAPGTYLLSPGGKKGRVFSKKDN